MGSRRVYRGIEEAALLGRFEDSSYPHSFLARRLRYLYRESRDAMDAIRRRVSVQAALHASPLLDAPKVYPKVMERLAQAEAMLYYTEGSRKSRSPGGSRRGSPGELDGAKVAALLRGIKGKIAAGSGGASGRPSGG